MQTIPEDRVAVAKPWDPRTKVVARRLIKKIKAANSDVEVYYTGASALKLPGENDLDFTILCPKEDFSKHLPKLESMLGKPQKVGKENIRWEGIEIEGFPADIYLTDDSSGAFKEHLQLFKLLKNNRKLWEEYKIFKEQTSGLPYREYQRRKYELYNKVLGL